MSFFSIRLFQSNDPSHMFGELAQVVFYVLFLIDIFFIPILQYWAGWGLKFVICFNLLFIELSRSYDLSCKFDILTRVFLGPFLIDFFSNFILQYQVDWELSFIIYFDLLSIGLSQSHNQGHEFDTLTQVFKGQSNMLLF